MFLQQGLDMPADIIIMYRALLWEGGESADEGNEPSHFQSELSTTEAF